MIKLIAIDIDGTLLTPLKKLTSENKRAILAAKEGGIKIVLASGRPISSMRKYLKELDLCEEDDYCIAQNGSYLHRASDGAVLSSINNEKKDLPILEKALKDFSLDLSYMDEERFFTPSKNPGFFTRMNSKVTGRELIYAPYETFPEDKKFGRFLAMGRPSKISKFYGDIPQNLADSFYIVKTSPFQIEIMNKDTNKGKGLEALAKRLGIDPSEILALGNEENDIPMIEYAGVGVAMGNGNKKLRDVADFVTKSNLKSGVAFAIEKFTK